MLGCLAATKKNENSIEAKYSSGSGMVAARQPDREICDRLKIVLIFSFIEFIRTTIIFSKLLLFYHRLSKLNLCKLKFWPQLINYSRNCQMNINAFSFCFETTNTIFPTIFRTSLTLIRANFIRNAAYYA